MFTYGWLLKGMSIVYLKKNVILETVAMGFFPWDPDAAGWF